MKEFFLNSTNSVFELPFLGLVISIFCIYFAFNKYRPLTYIITFSIYLISLNLSKIFWIFYLSLIIIFSVPKIRISTITSLVVALIKKLDLLPKISETEKIALTSGTIWVDGELFSGSPNFKYINSQKLPKLTKEEISFLENEVEEICKICIDYEVQKLRDLPEKVWDYLAEKKFFGMIIPKEYGGLGFSAYAHSCVIEKLSSRSVPLAITAMVPNSLGPAELLLHYGTKKQREHYLPRLADGRDLPCFALTEPNAGSDATSIISNGIIFRDGNNEIKIRLNWNKRYITLGAYATVIGLAFQLKDPENILFENEDVGITCALIPYDTKGVRQGRRHDPLSTPFVNSPINGENVIIGLDAIIGEKDGLGKGWKMLMECLAAGRGISLPSTSSGGSKLVTRVVTAYTSIREQFGVAIAKFEGVEEVMARIISRTYALDAMRSFTAGSVDSGAKPAVVSAIAKYHSTEIFRQNINDGMDIIAGSGIIRGKRNILANAYFSAPISITVEGSNIMTRSLIHFGQGAIMCHPYSYKEMIALEQNNMVDFDRAFFAHIAHLISNFARSVVLSLTRGYVINFFKKDLISKYERKISWCSATFALLADIAIARFGGNLKRKEKINGRFGDILSAMYISVSILRKFDCNGRKKEEEPIVEYALKEQLIKAQNAFDGLYQNLFGCYSKILLFPFSLWSKFNSISCPPSDYLSHQVVKDTTKNGYLRNSLTKGIYISYQKDDNLGKLENALLIQEKCELIKNKIKLAIKNKLLPRKNIYQLINLAYKEAIINLEEKHLIEDAEKILLDAVQVDEYTLEEYKKTH